jgi:hypothetical protein
MNRRGFEIGLLQTANVGSVNDVAEKPLMVRRHRARENLIRPIKPP